MISQPRLMGILNVTPDSFSDGGLYLDTPAAVDHGRAMVAEGADIVDVGGESTRPGAEPVPAAQELARVLPVVEGLAAARTGALISLDTSKASVAAAGLRAGAGMINDISALRADPAMAAVIAESGAECCLMHMRGTPRTMQRSPRYEDVVDEVCSFLEERLAFAVREGIAEERLLLDPGIGFGKSIEHNLQLIDRLDRVVAIGPPVLIGLSRKGFLGRLVAGPAADAQAPDPAHRLPGTIACNVIALERGAAVFRVHDVGPVRDALRTAAATLAVRWTSSPPATTASTPSTRSHT